MDFSFYSSSRSNCLLSPPSNNEILANYTQMLPGDTFEVDRQCELEFGPGHTRCTMALDVGICIIFYGKDELICQNCFSHPVYICGART